MRCRMFVGRRGSHASDGERILVSVGCTRTEIIHPQAERSHTIGEAPRVADAGRADPRLVRATGPWYRRVLPFGCFRREDSARGKERESAARHAGGDGRAGWPGPEPITSGANTSTGRRRAPARWFRTSRGPARRPRTAGASSRPGARRLGAGDVSVRPVVSADASDETAGGVCRLVPGAREPGPPVGESRRWSTRIRTSKDGLRRLPRPRARASFVHRRRLAPPRPVGREPGRRNGSRRSPGRRTAWTSAASRWAGAWQTLPLRNAGTAPLAVTFTPPGPVSHGERSLHVPSTPPAPETIVEGARRLRPGYADPLGFIRRSARLAAGRLELRPRGRRGGVRPAVPRAPSRTSGFATCPPASRPRGDLPPGRRAAEPGASHHARGGVSARPSRAPRSDGP
jgi:hypothetical protein